MIFFELQSLANGERCSIALMPSLPLKNDKGDLDPIEALALVQEPSDVVKTTGIIEAKTHRGDRMLSEERIVVEGGEHLWRGYYAVVQKDKFASILLTANFAGAF